MENPIIIKSYGWGRYKFNEVKESGYYRKNLPEVMFGPILGPFSLHGLPWTTAPIYCGIWTTWYDGGARNTKFLIQYLDKIELCSAV